MSALERAHLWYSNLEIFAFHSSIHALNSTTWLDGSRAVLKRRLRWLNLWRLWNQEGARRVTSKCGVRCNLGLVGKTPIL